MYTRTFYPYTGAYRVYPVIKRFHYDLGFLARLTYDVLYHDQSVKYLRYFLLQQFSEECSISTGQYNNRSIVPEVDTFHDSTYCFAFFIEVGFDLLRLRQEELIAFLIEEQYLFL